MKKHKTKFEKYLAAHNAVFSFIILGKHNIESWCISEKCRVEGSQNSNETRLNCTQAMKNSDPTK